MESFIQSCLLSSWWKWKSNWTIAGAGPKPTPKPPGGGGPMGIDLSAITNIKLKKVGVPADDRPKPTETDKIYSEEGGVKSAFEKFKQKGKKITVKIHKINDALLNFVYVKLLKRCM